MNTEASAAFDALSGLAAFRGHYSNFTEPEIWIWDGLRGVYYLRDGRYHRETQVNLIEMEQLAESQKDKPNEPWERWHRIAVPVWFASHVNHENH